MVRGYGIYVMTIVRNGSWKCDGSVEEKTVANIYLQDTVS
jgi:hypothetical protein